jgi:putative glutamine amidotransferase
VIEAVESIPGHSDWSKSLILGVQWHPERTYDQSALSRALFARLISEAAAWTPRPVTTSVA